MDARIEKIKSAERASAEKKAALLAWQREDTERANAEAAKKVESAEKDAERLIAEASAKAACEAEATLAEAAKNAEMEAKALTANAESRLPAVAEEIIREIFKS